MHIYIYKHTCIYIFSPAVSSFIFISFFIVASFDAFSCLVIILAANAYDTSAPLTASASAAILP